MSDYPKRDSMFAIAYIRWLSDSGAAAEVGPDAFALLAAIATKEDELHYSRPPNFFNEQLASRCGIVSVHALIRARQRAVDAGLLHYEPATKRRPGRYFVCGFHAQSAGKAEGKRKESATLHTQYPIPNTPIRKTGFEPLEIDLPKELQGDAFKTAWAEWCSHRKELKKPLTKTTCDKQLRKLAAFGVERAVKAIDQSIESGWQGLFEPASSNAAKRDPSHDPFPSKAKA